MQLRKKFFLLALLFFSASVIAAPHHSPLPMDEAFVFFASSDRPQEIIASWRIAPGYQLYRQRFHFTFTPPIEANVDFPQGELKYDIDHGRYEAYTNSVVIPI